MIENTRPERHGPESETEQRMRADFMYAWCSISRDCNLTDKFDYAEYANPWVRQEYWNDEWAYLSTATHRWKRNPTRAARALDVNRRLLSSIQQRSEEQARYIAEHGIEHDDHGLLTSHYVTRLATSG